MLDFFKLFRSGESKSAALAGGDGHGDAHEVHADLDSRVGHGSHSGQSRMSDAERAAQRRTEEAAERRASKKDGGIVKVLKKGPAMRVIFFYPGEEGTYIDNADVTLYENGIIHIKSHQEETTTHLQNCEILWRFETEAEDRANKVRLLKPKGHAREEEGGVDREGDKKGPPAPEHGPQA